MGTDGVLIFVGLVFLAVFLLSQGLVMPVFGENKAARKRLQQRLKDIEATEEESIVWLLREKNLRRLAPFERQLEELPWLQRLKDFIDQSGNNIPAYRLVLISVVLASIAGVVSWQLSRSPSIAIVATLVALAAPFLKISRDRSNRFAKLEEQLPEAIDTIQRALKAGHPFNGTLKMVADDMEEPISREFELTFADINYGRDPETDLGRHPLSIPIRTPSAHIVGRGSNVRLGSCHGTAHPVRGHDVHKPGLPPRNVQGSNRPADARFRGRLERHRRLLHSQDHQNRGVGDRHAVAL
jgi:Flp pilus assembly protein TadB